MIKRVNKASKEVSAPMMNVSEGFALEGNKCPNDLISFQIYSERCFLSYFLV